MSACVAKNSNSIDTINLPSFPLAGDKVADELEVICQKNDCTSLVIYFNEIYIFRKVYNIYKEELQK